MANKSDPFPNLPRRALFIAGDGRVIELNDSGTRVLNDSTPWESWAAKQAGPIEVKDGVAKMPIKLKSRRDRKAYMRDYMAKKRAKAKT